MAEPVALRLHLPDAVATEEVGAALASCVAGGMFIALEGDLGTGKTTLARGLLHAAGVGAAVKSPTYTLVESYNASSLDFYHFDFYRFNDPAEWESTGFADCFDSASVCVVEWPERAHGFLPTPDLGLALAHAAPPAAGRILRAVAHTQAGERCVETLRRRFPALIVATA
jgi:tRNA threonylcarbamoyladenosine biosynthesis protein TsaE